MSSDSQIEWSYSYQTRPSETTWAHRMDHYYKIGNSKIHWVQQILSIAISVCLIAVICLILKCGLSRDIVSIKE